jgi:hypothetical protein
MSPDTKKSDAEDEAEGAPVLVSDVARGACGEGHHVFTPLVEVATVRAPEVRSGGSWM